MLNEFVEKILVHERARTVTGYEQSQKSAEKFIALIDKYENFDTLTNTMLNEFVEKILVHERARRGSQDTTQEIDIYFNFIGNYYPPVETISKEERRAAIEAEQLRKRREKGKRSAERRKQKLDELRKAAEAGDEEVIAQYAEYLEKQKERGRRYRQKLKEAKEADPEHIRQMEEKECLKREKMLEAERKRIERASRKAKLSRAELKEKAKTDPEAAKEWEAMKAREAEAGSSEAVRRYEVPLAKRREDYHKKKKEVISA